MTRRLWTDERAIEGLPIRLVIALVVGVASLAVMMSVLGGFDAFNATELDTQPDPDIVGPGNHTVDVTVVDPDGTPIEGATVIAQGETAQLASPERAESNSSGVAQLDLDVSLAPNQEEGTIELDIRPPDDGDYQDERENTDILVLAG